MNTIYSYLDYRRFLDDYYQEEKSKNKKFSLRYFALKSGYSQSTSSFFASVVRGRRNLSDEYIRKFCKGLGFSGREAEYFEQLVRFNQEKSLEAKNRQFEKLLSLTPNKYKLLAKDQYDFFSQWYHLAIWGILGFCPQKKANVDYNSIGSILFPSIPPGLIRQSILLLERLQFIVVDDSGFYRQAHPVLSTGDEVRSIQVANYQIETMKLAIEAIDRCPAPQRDISTLTLNISSNGFQKIKTKVRQFRKELLTIAQNDAGEDRIYQCNFQIFPLTKISDAKEDRS